jgi:hypothetical protein
MIKVIKYQSQSGGTELLFEYDGSTYDYVYTGMGCAIRDSDGGIVYNSLIGSDNNEASTHLYLDVWAVLAELRIDTNKAEKFLLKKGVGRTSVLNKNTGGYHDIAELMCEFKRLQ